MTKLQELEEIINVVDKFWARLKMEGHDSWADSIATTREDLFWQYREMSEFESE